MQKEREAESDSERTFSKKLKKKSMNKKWKNKRKKIILTLKE